MPNDILYLIAPHFDVPGRDDGPFVCPFCNQLEGLLASFPERTANLEVIRVPFARPRAAVIAAVGEENQALPLLILGTDAPQHAKRHGSVEFLADTDQILERLATHHNFPRLLRPQK